MSLPEKSPVAVPTPGRVGAGLTGIKARLLAHRGKILTVLLGQGTTAIGLAVGSRVVTEVVAPEALGQYKLAVGAMGLVSGLFFRPFVQFVMRQYHDANEKNCGPEFLSFALRVLTGAGLILGVCVAAALFLYGHITGSLGLLAALAAAGLMYLHSALNFQNGILVTQNRQKFANILRVVGQCGIPFAIALGAVALGQSGRSLLIAEVVLLVLVLLVSTRLLPIRLSTAGRASDQDRSLWLVEARRFIVPMIGVGVFSWILSVSDRYILEAFASTHEVGLYTAVYGLGSQPMLMVTGVTAQLIYPFLFRAAAQQRAEAQAQIHRYVIATTAGAALLGMGALLLLGNQIVNLLLAANYRENACSILLWVAAGYAALSIASAFELKSYAGKRTSLIATAYAVAGVTNLGLNLLWVPQLGALGAAKATFFGFLVYLVVLSMLTVFRKPPEPNSPAAQVS